MGDPTEEVSDPAEGLAKRSDTPNETIANNDNDNDDDDDDDDECSDEVSLGFAVERSEPNALLRNQFVSKMGGSPAWLDPAHLPLESELRCKVTDEPLRYLLQLYAPCNDDPRAFHRALYLFVSPKGSQLSKPGAVRAFRCQLPRENAWYPYDPPEPDDYPSPLSVEAAELATTRCAPYAEDGATESGLRSVYEENELVVEPEPDASEAAAANPEVSRLMDEYRAKAAAAEAAEAARGGGGASATTPDLSMFPEAPDTALDDFGRFTARISRAPEQCIRYTFSEKASPLWASRHRRVELTDVPSCERCGAARRFEFQVMPQALTFLGIDSEHPESPDWATIAVYTCSASCSPLPPLPAAGSAMEDPTGGATSPAALAAVGLRATITGLASRTDLNGRECTILGWSEPPMAGAPAGGGGRWAVEVLPLTGGDKEREAREKVRIRSANLQPHALDSSTGHAREGGYAEEYVWVQYQGD